MATLSTLKLSAAVKPTSVPAVQLRRNKLVLRLWEQCELARAQAAGTTFAPVKFRSVVEHDTGIRRQVEMPKRVTDRHYGARHDRHLGATFFE